MAGLDHFSLQLSLQLGVGRGNVGEPALLAVPDGATWQIPQGLRGEAGAAAFAASVAGTTRAGDLGACRLCGRGAGGCRFSGRTSAPLPAASDLHFNDYRHRSGARPQTLCRGECVLFSDGLRICSSSLFAGAASGISGDCGDRILAKLHAACACAEVRGSRW